MSFPEPLTYNSRAAFFTLFEKEILRFRKIALHSICAPILTSTLYLLVFGNVLEEKMTMLAGVSYIDFLVPGLVMMALLQNSFANSASSILQSKIIGNMMFVLMPLFSGCQLAAAYICASVVRGLVVAAGVFAASPFWIVPPLAHPIWALFFALYGAGIMASLGVICGLWAEKYDQMGAFQTFVILPLTFLSGVFYSVSQLPPLWAKLSLLNSFFYKIDGLRYGFFGKSDFPAWLSLTVTASSCLALVFAATMFFVKGYKLVK